MSNAPTTVPFNVECAYKSVLWRGLIPVFTDLPIEEDFDLAVKGVTFWNAAPRIIVDLDFFVVTISKAKDGKYHMCHEFSLEEKWSNFALTKVTITWEELMLLIKEVLKTHALNVEAYLRKLKRMLETPI